MSAPPAASSTLLGYQMIGRSTLDGKRPVGFRPVGRRAWRDSPAALEAVAGRHLRPRLAVVLGRDVVPGTAPGAVFLALAGCCLVIEVVDGGGAIAGAFVGERLLEPEADGTVTLFGPAGVSVGEPASVADVVAQVSWLAAAAAGLPAGRLVFPVPARPAEPLPVAAGVWQADGPDGSTLAVTVTP